MNLNFGYFAVYQHMFLVFKFCFPSVYIGCWTNNVSFSFHVVLQVCWRISLLADFEELTHLLFPIFRDIPHTYYLNGASLHAFYVMATMLINFISSHTNDAYEAKRGLAFSSFSLIHESGSIVFPPICTCLVVLIMDLSNCTRHLH